MGDSPNPQAKSWFFYGWVIVLAAFIAMLVAGLLSIYGIFFAPLSQEFGWSRANLSLAYSIYFAIVTFLAFATGRLSDRYGVRKVMAVGAVIAGCGLLLCSQVSSLFQLCLFFGVAGVGMSCLFVPSMSTISRWFVRRRGLAIGITSTAFGFGLIMFSPLTEILITSYGWRATFLIFGFMAMALLLVATAMMRQDPGRMGQFPDGHVRAEGLMAGPTVNDHNAKEALRKRSFWCIYGIRLATDFTYMLLMVHIVPHAIDTGFSGIEAAAALTLLGIIGIPARGIGGFVCDRFNKFNLIRIFLVVETIAPFILLLAGGTWAIYLSVVVLGIGYGGWTILSTLSAGELFGTKDLGMILGFIDTAVGIGGMLGPYIGGYIFDVNGSYSLAFIASGLLMVGAVVLSGLLRRENSVR